MSTPDGPPHDPIAASSSDPDGLSTPGEILARAKRGVPWLAVDSASSQLLSLAISVAVARILVPKDFGLYTMALVFTDATYVVGNLGVSAALIQKNALADGDPDVAFTLSAAVGIILTITIAALSPLAALIFANPDVQPVLFVKSSEILFTSFGTTANAMLQRQLRYKQLTAISVGGLAIHGLVAVSLALAGFGVWSLVWGSVAAALFRAIAANSLAGYLPRLRLQRKALQPLLNFGIGLSVKNVLVIGGRNIDNLIVGRLLGEAALGIYARAFSLAMIPRKQLHGVMHQLLFPAFSRAQTNPALLRQWFVKTADALAVLMVPLMLGLAVTANDLIIALYTDKWAMVTVPFQLLCLAVIPLSVGGVAGSTLESIARIGVSVRIEAAYLAIIALGGVIATYLAGGVGMAAVVLGAAVFSFVAHGCALRSAIGLSLGSFVATIARPLAPAVVMSVCVILAASLGSTPWTRLAIEALAGVSSYAFLILVFARTRYLHLLRRLNIVPTAPLKRFVGI